MKCVSRASVKGDMGRAFGSALLVFAKSLFERAHITLLGGRWLRGLSKPTRNP